MSELLFAYGTLRPGLAPPGLGAVVAALDWLGPATVPGRLYDFGAYPGGVLAPDAHARIHGELAALPGEPGLWERLDRYEGWQPDDPGASLFRRVRCTASRAGGERHEAWIYEYARAPGDARRLPDGRYPGATRDSMAGRVAREEEA